MPRPKKTDNTTPDPGHNSLNRDQLKNIVERIEGLEGQKAEIAVDLKDVYAEAKSAGFDVKAMREVIRRRKQDKAERDEHQNLVDEYMHALGDLADLPLGKAAMARSGLMPPV